MLEQLFFKFQIKLLFVVFIIISIPLLASCTSKNLIIDHSDTGNTYRPVSEINPDTLTTDPQLTKMRKKHEWVFGVTVSLVGLVSGYYGSSLLLTGELPGENCVECLDKRYFLIGGGVGLIGGYILGQKLGRHAADKKYSILKKQSSDH